jgi:hypothetical protein
MLNLQRDVRTAWRVVTGYMEHAAYSSLALYCWVLLLSSDVLAFATVSIVLEVSWVMQVKVTGARITAW